MRHATRTFTLGALAALALFCCLPSWHSSQAQEQPDVEARKREVLDRVHRARRLREFGYPLLARAQLDLARAKDAASRETLLEYVRLFTQSDATIEETEPYVYALLELYPEDYEACLELGRYLYMKAEPPLPPDTRKPETVKSSLLRLDAEMVVYRELARFLLKPEGDLPASAKGKPGLSLAYLARALKKAPGSAECLYLAGQDLFFRAQTFQGWSFADESLAPFGKAAEEIFALAEPLFRGCAGSETYTASSGIYLVELLVRSSRFEAAQREAIAAELLNPNSQRIANALGDIAEATKDVDLLVKALSKRHALFRDASSDLDLRAATRIRDNKWPFVTWQGWVELDLLGGEARRSAITALLKARPEFLELYFLQAINCLTFAYATDNPDDKRKWLDAALNSLDQCKSLGDTFADWHRRRGLTLWLLGRYGDAAAAYEQTAKLSPEDTLAVAYTYAGKDIAAGLYTSTDYDDYRKLQEPGDFKEKRKLLLELVQRAPKFTAAWMALGEVAQILGDFATAFAANSKALELAPGNFNLLEGAAQAALWESRWTDAVDLYQRLLDLNKDRPETLRMLSLSRDLKDAPETRRKAFHLWQEAQRPVESQAGKRKKLEEALVLDGTLPEVLIDIAVLERGPNPARAESLLEKALRHSRDDFTKAAAHRERGRLFAGARAFDKAIGEFESAFAANRGDGADLMLAALALTQKEDHGNASAAMRKLFAEVPGTPLLRPRDADLHRLGLAPARANAPVRVHPNYGRGDKATFSVQLAVEGEGGGQLERKLSLEYEMSMEVLEVPEQGGLWQLRLTFGEPPTVEFAAMKLLVVDLKISPWFGLTTDPAIGALEEVISPAVQALCEAFTAGMGDSAVPPPLVFKNVLTRGPAHFGGDDANEAAAVTEVMGDSVVVQRRAVAGREIGDSVLPSQTEITYTRGLRAWVKLSGAKRGILEAGYEIGKQELTKERDDVVKSRLLTRLVLK
ncbi:MAG: hypothetical protein IPP14_00660 [Planctomycetes bacterium]|nr:hypothetical protein [Planctomycetota bacterium]